MAGFENRPPARANGASMGDLGDRREATSGTNDSQSTGWQAWLKEPVVVAKLWKSPRDKSETIVVALKQFSGFAFLDCRLFSTNRLGQSLPTTKGISVSRQRLPEFFAAMRKAEAKAIELGLISGGGS